MADRTVRVRLTADTSQYDSAMRRAASGMDGVDKAQDQAQKRAQRWQAVGAASRVAGAAMAAGLALATKAASDQEQALGGLDAVFKTHSASMRRSAEEATKLGLSQTQYAEGAVRVGAQLANLGLNQDQVAASTQTLMERAADLSAQFGGSTLEAVEALSAVFRGEADPAERYGLSLNITAVNAEMAATGLGKAEAIMSLLNKQMQNSGSIGAAAREFDTAAASAQRMQAEFDNAAAALGEALLPAMTTGAQAAGKVLAAFNSLPDPLKQAASFIGVFGTAALIIGPHIATAVGHLNTLKVKFAETALGARLSGTAVGAFGTALKGAAGPIGALIAVLGALAVHAGNVRARGEELADTLDEVSGAATKLTLTNLGEEFLANFSLDELRETPFTLREIVRAAAEGGPAFDDLRQRVLEWSQAIAVNGTFAQSRMASALLSAVDAAGRDADAMREVAAASEEAAAASEGAGAAAAAASDYADESARGWARDARAKEEAAAAARKLKADLESLISIQLALSGSKDALLGQEKRLTAAVKEHGSAVAGNSRGAQENRRALDQEMSAIVALADARKRDASALGDADAGQRAFNQTIKQQVPQLLAAADAAGLNTRQTADYLAKLTQLPRRKITEILAKGADKSKKDIDAHNRSANQTPKSKATNMSSPGAKGSKKDIDAHNKSANSTPKSKATNMSAPGAKGSKGDIDAHNKSAGDVPGSKSTTITAPGATTSKSQIDAAASSARAAEGTYTITLKTVKVTAYAKAVESATGGYISGPGTSTSDSIPAMLSNGEYVVRAAAVDKYGTGFLDRVNAMRYSGGGSVPKWARKNMPPWVAEMVEKLGFLDREWWEYNAPRLPGSKQYVGDRWRDKPEQRKGEKDKDYAERVKEWKREREAIRRQFNETVRREKLDRKWEKRRERRERKQEKADGAFALAADEARERVQAMRDVLRQRADDTMRLYEALQADKDAYMRAVESAMTSGLAMTGAFDFGAAAAATRDLAAAEDELRDARRALNEADDPRQRADLLLRVADAERRVGEAAKASQQAQHTPGNILAAMKARADLAAEYGDRVAQLDKRGLSSAIIDDLATMNPEQAIDMVRAYSAMSAAQIGQVNAEQARLVAAAGRLSGTLGAGRFDAAIATAGRAAWDAQVQVNLAAAPVVLEIDGQAIARSLIEYKRRTGDNRIVV